MVQELTLAQGFAQDMSLSCSVQNKSDCVVRADCITHLHTWRCTAQHPLHSPRTETTPMPQSLIATNCQRAPTKSSMPQCMRPTSNLKTLPRTVLRRHRVFLEWARFHSLLVQEVAPTTHPSTESFDQARRGGLRQRDHGHIFCPTEG